MSVKSALLSPLLRRILTVFAWIALTVNFFFPTRAVQDATLDNSNYASYAYFTAEGFKYGSEVVPMCGPYGFVMYGWVYGGELFWTRLVAELCVKGLLAGLALWFWAQARGTPVVRWLWLISLVLFMVGIEDYPVDWLILLSGLWIIRHTGTPGDRYRSAAIAIALGMVALIKGTHLAMTLATLGGALLPSLARRDWRQIVTVAGTFLVSLVGWWLLAGQRLTDLFAYVRGILELSSGYNVAMTLDEGFGTFARGASLAVLLIALCGWTAVARRREITTVAGLALLIGFVFLKWKHGFVRADGHIFIFFCFAAVALWTWLMLPGSLKPDGAPLSGWSARIGVLLSTGGLLLALFGLGSGQIRHSTWVYEFYPEWLRGKITHLLDPATAKVLLDAQLHNQQKFYSMPATRQLVGDGTVDMFGFEHGIILLNNMRYTPRPIGGGAFSTFTAYLMHRNGDFMASERRPEFFLLKYQTVDNRLAAQDDPLTFLGLLNHYHPMLIEQGYAVFQERAAPPTVPPQPLASVNFRFNQTVKVPPVPDDRLVLASFTIKPSLWGRLRTAFYKPPLIFMNQLGQGLRHGESRRLVPSMARLPFPVSPVIETNDDVLALYTRGPGKTLYDFRLTTDGPSAFDPDLTVTFHSVARPPVPNHVDIEELIVSSRYPLTNAQPATIKPADAPIRQLGGVLVQMLMPPAEMTWKLEGNEREFLFDYGYEPTAYEEITGNGTIFIAEIRTPGQPVQEIFRRKLDPAHHPTERSTQSARLVLPGSIRAGAQLAIRTDPGEFNDNAWDWAFVTKIQLKRGEYSPRQFPAFNRVPTVANMEQANLVDTDSGRVLILHAPGFLDFRLHGNESTLGFDFGFMPGAYTGEGSTDGAVYLVELVRPNQPRETLFRRVLEPRKRPEDQGRQRATLTLPKLGPADNLILTISPGPTGDNSWDWTYVTNFELK